jgi:saccharopine dehydrogenase (NADP+, L-glutamate forming)
MYSIVILGAGRSAGYLIDYFAVLCQKQDWSLKIADFNTSHLSSYEGISSNIQIIACSLDDAERRREIIQGANWVISLLPAYMHVDVAKDCILENCNLATASYVSEEMRIIGKQAEQQGLVFINECGLDPGIDHMSALKILNELRANGATITGFESYCGGLIAEDSLGDNPWKYKFSWNPRNVILAGNAASTGLINGRLKIVPYQRNFQFPTTVTLPDGRNFDAYINRDSLGYRSIYGLENVDTMIRGTLRYPGYCRAWNILIHLGLTDHTYLYPLHEGMTYKDFFHSFLNGDNHSNIHASIRNTLEFPDYESDAIDMVLWTGLNDETIIPVKEGSPASILQVLLEDKWKLEKQDKDLVVMQHKIKYSLKGESLVYLSSLSLEGENSVQTAMSKTVGLPLAMTVKQFIINKLPQKGIVLPIYPEIYEPVLEELSSYGISFQEEILSEAIAEGKPE